MKGSQQSSSSTLNSQLSQQHPLQSSKTGNPNNNTPQQSSSLLTSSFASRSKTSVQKQEVKKNKVLSDEDDNYQIIKEQRERDSSSESSSSFSDDEILPTKRNKNPNGRIRGNRSRSRSNQSGIMAKSIAEVQQKNTKKRKIDEISTASGGVGAFTTTNNLQKNSQLYKQNDLWIEKYAPQALEEMIIQDKKIKEFSEIMQNPKAKLLLITGPPGCGKNSLVNLYCKHNNVQVMRYKEE